MCYFSLISRLLTVSWQKVSFAMSSKMLTATVAVRRGSVVTVHYNLFPWKFGTLGKLRTVF